MTTHIRKVLIILATFFIASAAQAHDYGRNMFHPNICQCWIAPPNTSMSPSEIVDLGAAVGTELPPLSGNGFQVGDTITACDGSACITIVLTALNGGTWQAAGSTVTTADSNKGYNNGQLTQKSARNSDTGTPIGSYYVYETVVSYANSVQKILTPIVIVTPLDATDSGLGAGLTSVGATSSYSFGADELAGGADQYAAEFGGSYSCGSTCVIMSD